MTADDIAAPQISPKKILFFGYGYVAGYIATRLAAQGWQISGTTTSTEKRTSLRKDGIGAWIFDRSHPLPDPVRILDNVTHVLISVPPDADGDPVCDIHGDDLAALPNLEWVGYISTTAVYGDQSGRWIDETADTNPGTRRGIMRLRAEKQWQALHLREGLPLHIFRLSGIYGPGRSALDAVRSGIARRIDKPDHVFNRMHVDDIAQTLILSAENPNPGAIYNLADDLPAPSHEVIQFACNLIGRDPPPLIPYDQAGVAPVVQSFYRENKRVRNDKIKNDLNVDLTYPNYRSGLQACLEVEEEADCILAHADDKK